MKINNEKYAIAILITFSTAFSFATGSDNRNLLLIGLISIVVPISFLIKFIFIKYKEFPVYLLIIYMALINAINLDVIKFSSFFYTLLFIITFIYYTRLIYLKSLGLDNYTKILQYLIYSYCIVLMLQQLCSLTGLPVINQITSMENDFKFNSLAPEPSHSARILTLLTYSFVCCKDIQYGKACSLKKIWQFDKRVLQTFLYSMLTMGSATAFLFLIILVVKFIKIKNIISLFFLLCLGYIGLHFIDSVSIQRSLKFIEALFTFDQEKLIEADHSGAIRILPVFVYLERFNLLDINYWMGNGCGYSIEYLRGRIEGISDDASAGGGFFPGFFLDYGLVGVIIFLSVVYIYCIRNFSILDILICLVIIPTSPLNTQVVWLTLILLATNKYFFKTIKIKNISTINFYN